MASGRFVLPTCRGGARSSWGHLDRSTPAGCSQFGRVMPCAGSGLSYPCPCALPLIGAIRGPSQRARQAVDVQLGAPRELVRDNRDLGQRTGLRCASPRHLGITSPPRLVIDSPIMRLAGALHVASGTPPLHSSGGVASTSCLPHQSPQVAGPSPASPCKPVCVGRPCWRGRPRGLCGAGACAGEFERISGPPRSLQGQ